MKKFLLASLLLVTIGFTNVNAQILNPGFETWNTDTAYFDGINNFFPKDTFTYLSAADWTTTNGITGADTLGGRLFVRQTNVRNSGQYAMELTTDTIDPVVYNGLTIRLTIPGLALNGRFPLDIGDNVLQGGTISPAAIPGAGTPVNKRLASVKGYYDYAPVYNDSLGHVDSCVIWAVLKSQGTVVASAYFTSGDTTNGYRQFSSPFTYTGCGMPDTLVILMSASIPNFANLPEILTGRTKLARGSVLRVDDLEYDTLVSNATFAPFANDDLVTTKQDSAITVLVKNNDEDCDNPIAGLTLAITQQAGRGNATLNANASIGYTPNAGYYGADTFYYSINDGVTTDTARVRVLISRITGISEANLVSVAVFPVPASNDLNIQFENNGKSFLRIFDMVGNLVHASVMTKNNNVINVATLANGIYGIQIADENNAVIARSKFTVSK